MDVAEIKRERDQVLLALYRALITGEQEATEQKLIEETCLSEQVVSRALKTLQAQGLLSMGPEISRPTYFLTREGQKEAERLSPATSVSAPPAFGATVSYNSVSYITNSPNAQVVQSSPNTSITTDSKNAIVALLDGVERAISASSLTDKKVDELRAGISSIRGQLQSPAPKASVLTECLRSIKTICEGAAGSALVNYVPQITATLAAIQS